MGWYLLSCFVIGFIILVVQLRHNIFDVEDDPSILIMVIPFMGILWPLVLLCAGLAGVGYLTYLAAKWVAELDFGIEIIFHKEDK